MIRPSNFIKERGYYRSAITDFIIVAFYNYIFKSKSILKYFHCCFIINKPAIIFNISK